jgi:hypothetical protein
MTESKISHDYHIGSTKAAIKGLLSEIGATEIFINSDLNSGAASIDFIYQKRKYHRASAKQKNASRNLAALRINLQHKIIDAKRGCEEFGDSIQAYLAIGPGEGNTSQGSAPVAQSEPASREDFVLLEVSEAATADEIKKAYRHQMQAWHPDRFASDAEMQKKAQAKTSSINSAYQRICGTRGI